MPINPASINVIPNNNVVELVQPGIITVQIAAPGPQGPQGPAGSGGTNTGSLLTTASANLNTITFTKGNGDLFSITVDTGSGGGGGTGGVQSVISSSAGAYVSASGNNVIVSASIFRVSASSIQLTGSLTSSNAVIFSNTNNQFTGSFTGSLVGSLTGNADSATNATTADNANKLGGRGPEEYALLNAVDNTQTFTKITTFTSGAIFNNTTTINGNLNVVGTASFTYTTASQLDVGTNTISVNVGEPAQRFGGLIVYDSGSLSHQATASLLWDSLNNHWVYQNVSGSTYSGGMLINGPRNLGALGNEQGTTNNALMKGQGGDHITSSALIEDGTKTTFYGNTVITSGSSVSASSFTGSLSGSLVGTGSWAISASSALTASNTPNAITTASVSLNTITFTKGNGTTFPITVNTGSGGGGSSVNLGITYAFSIGLQNMF